MASHFAILQDVFAILQDVFAILQDVFVPILSQHSRSCPSLDYWKQEGRMQTGAIRSYLRGVELQDVGLYLTGLSAMFVRRCFDQPSHVAVVLYGEV